MIKRNYTVEEIGLVYYTLDMDRTAGWFADTLGWFYSIDERDENGNGIYGCVFDKPEGTETLNVMHILNGEPKGGKLALIKVTGIDGLHGRVTGSGWEQITGIINKSWARTCDVTTVDGYVIEFFE